MNVLALETTWDVADLAVLDAEGLAATLAFRHRMDLSQLLVPRLQQLLEMAHLEARELDAIAVSLGPGSFTGIRIGVATAKALALALKRPILGVPTLDALAAAEAVPPGTLVCPLVSARAGEVFAGLYRAEREGPVRLQGESLLTVEAVAEQLAARGQPVRFTGETEPYHELLAERFGEAAVAGTGNTRPRAEWVAWLARARRQAGAADDTMNLAPIYVRPSAAEARWREAQCPS